MSVKQGNRVALKEQVAQALKQRIRLGEYSTGDLLPSIRQLSQEFGVGRGVLQVAIRDMESEGIVRAHHGKGVKVESAEGASSTAILFGIIHPYSSDMDFSREIHAYVNEAFARRNNFAVVRSSNDDAEEERRQAEFLISNGARGLILWHTKGNANAEYFAELSKKTPVVLIDREYEGTELPSVVLDYHTAGLEMFDVVMTKKKRRKMLVVMDNLRLDTYSNLTAGLEDAARQAGRAYDVTFMQFPITHLLRSREDARGKEVVEFGKHLREIVKNNGYDALMCPQSDFLAQLLHRAEDVEWFQSLQLATFRGSHQRIPTQEQLLIHASRYKYDEQGNMVPTIPCLRWEVDYGDMVSVAANRIQEWLLARKKPKDNVRIRMKLSDDVDWILK